MKWISVDEREPDVGNDVLFLTDNGIAEGYRNGEGGRYAYRISYSCDADACYGDPPKVTHWMPLPDSPE